MVHQDLHRGGTKPVSGFRWRCMLPQEMLAAADVFTPIAQWRQVDLIVFRRKCGPASPPLLTSALRSAFVAEIIRTLTLRVFDEPSRSEFARLVTRSSSAAASSGRWHLIKEQRCRRPAEASNAIGLGVGKRALEVPKD